MNRKRKAKQNKFLSLVNPLTALLLVAVIVLSVSVISLYSKLNKELPEHAAVYGNTQQLEAVQEGEWVHLSNYTLGDIAIPAAVGAQKCTYDTDNIITDDNGFKHYYIDNELRSYVGIDVSQYNVRIDWDAVKACGVDFVMIRIGGRGYGESGVMYSDDSLISNLKGAKAAGLDVGGYFFSQARTVDEAKEEARYALKLLKGHKLDYPLAFDWEIVDSVDSTRIDSVTPEMLTDCARAFCDTVSSRGYIPAIYAGEELVYYKYNLAELADIDLWYAKYSDTPTMYYNYMMWQYSSTGKVDGITGDVDLNICFKNYK